jgi:hypothetical protein
VISLVQKKMIIFKKQNNVLKKYFNLFLKTKIKNIFEYTRKEKEKYEKIKNKEICLIKLNEKIEIQTSSNNSLFDIQTFINFPEKNHFETIYEEKYYKLKLGKEEYFLKPNNDEQIDEIQKKIMIEKQEIKVTKNEKDEEGYLRIDNLTTINMKDRWKIEILENFNLLLIKKEENWFAIKQFCYRKKTSDI